MAIIMSSPTRFPASIVYLRSAPELGASLHGLPQDVARRHLRQLARARQPFRLRALSGTGRSEHHDVDGAGAVSLELRHYWPRRPLIRVFFMKPS